MADQPSADDRRAELLGGALGGDLDDAERRELDELLRTDPTAAAELAELTDLLSSLPPAGTGWVDTAGAAPALTPPGPSAGHRHREPRRPRRVSLSRWQFGLAAAALVAVGVGGGILGSDLTDRPVTGPPGTLGAVEALTVEDAPAGVDASTSVVAHTWGTETLLEVSGLPVGQTYVVEVVGDGGTTETAGSFLGAVKPVVCRMNAALLRPDVTQIQVRDQQGTVVFSSDLPPVA